MLPPCRSNSASIVSVSKCFYLCHPQPVGHQTSLESQRCKVSPVSFLGVTWRQPAQTPPHQVDSPPQWSGTAWQSGVPLCKDLNPRQHHISTIAQQQKVTQLRACRTPSRLHGPKYTASTSQNIQCKTLTVFKRNKQEAARENKHQMEWRSRVGKKKESSVVGRVHKASLRKWMARVGRRGKIRDGEFFLLF